MPTEISLYLASQSPRRKELLNQVGIPFSVISIDIDESIIPLENPENYVERLAKEKALVGFSSIKLKNVAVLGSDTSVVINGQILGKPVDSDDAVRMLNLLSGKTHQVMTAVALAMANNELKQPELRSVLNVSEVSFKKLSQEEIAAYVRSGECMDKAGSYAIQGAAAAFITHLSGSYSGVMGLPLFETVELLQKAGISIDSLVVS